jgi:hypothetical protein
MVQQTMVKRTREAKKNAAVSVIAMRLAKDKDDVIWKKASKFKKLFVAAKEAINKKYGQRASIEWMKKQNGATPAKK